MTARLPGILLLLLPLAVGCTPLQRYFDARALDLADCAKANVGVGIGLTADAKATDVMAPGIGIVSYTVNFGHESRKVNGVWLENIVINTPRFAYEAVAREMAKRNQGKIINTASIAGKGFRGTSNISYAGSKGAVIAMTRIGASQLARYNINVNAICPGATRTSMYERVMKQITEREGISETDATARMDASIPLRRSNTGDDIANMAAFLASAEADNITGQSFNVDGGLMWD